MRTESKFKHSKRNRNNANLLALEKVGFWRCFAVQSFKQRGYLKFCVFVVVLLSLFGQLLRIVGCLLQFASREIRTEIQIEFQFKAQT